MDELIQAFYELLQAELEIQNPDKLPERFAAIAGQAVGAQAAEFHDLGNHKPPGLNRQRHIEAGKDSECLILDAAMRGRYRAYWSVPVSVRSRAGVMQLGFEQPRRWHAGELQLLKAATQRCLAVIERRDLVEEERRRLRRELHDGAGQSLLFIKLELERLEKSMPEISGIRREVEQTIMEIRRIVRSLGPAALESMGLTAAIRQLAESFRQAYPAEFDLRLPELGRHSRETETVAYRFVQECFQNIAKHSRASKVKLSVLEADKFLELSVSDDGAGFDWKTAAGGKNSFGLKGMRERAALLGGKFRIRSAPGLGTSVRIRLPVSTQNHGENSNIPDR